MHKGQDGYVITDDDIEKAKKTMSYIGLTLFGIEVVKLLFRSRRYE